MRRIICKPVTNIKRMMGNGIRPKAFYYTHINGHRKETETVAYVLFEYEQLETVKYQVGYIACTCRGPEVNYYSVAFVELNKSDGSVKTLSYDSVPSDRSTPPVILDKDRPKTG